MIDWADAARHFSTTAVAHLATLRTDGGPRVVPVWVDREGDDDLVFFAEMSSLNARNVARDPRVALSITDPAQPLAMAAVRGEVIERVEGERALQLIDRIAIKYTGQPYAQRSGLVAFIVHPTSWTANDYS